MNLVDPTSKAWPYITASIVVLASCLMLALTYESGFVPSKDVATAIVSGLSVFFSSGLKWAAKRLFGEAT